MYKKYETTFKLVSEEGVDSDLVIPKNLPAEFMEDKDWINKYKERIKLDSKCFHGIKTDLEPIANDIYMFWGIDDQLFKIDWAYGWRKFTKGAFEMNVLNGGHFDIFLPENQKEIIKVIQSQIDNCD